MQFVGYLRDAGNNNFLSLYLSIEIVRHDLIIASTFFFACASWSELVSK